MSWYKRYLLAVRRIYVPADDYDKLIRLVDDISKGRHDWTDEEIQLRQNYVEAVEVLLREKVVA